MPDLPLRCHVVCGLGDKCVGVLCCCYDADISTVCLLYPLCVFNLMFPVCCFHVDFWIISLICASLTRLQYL